MAFEKWVLCGVGLNQKKNRKKKFFGNFHFRILFQGNNLKKEKKLKQNRFDSCYEINNKVNKKLEMGEYKKNLYFID